MSTNDLHAVIKELKEYKLLKEEAEARISDFRAWKHYQVWDENAGTWQDGNRWIQVQSCNGHNKPYWQQGTSGKRAYYLYCIP